MSGDSEEYINHKGKHRVKENFKSKKIVSNKNKLIFYDTIIYGLLFYLLINPKFLSLTKNIIPKKHFKEVLALIFASIYYLKNTYYD
jgi:hypothetical protein